MKVAAEKSPPSIRRFRVKIFVALMLVVVALSSLGIFVAQRRAAEDARTDLQRDFEMELAALHRVHNLRNAAVADRSRSLAQNARIHAALEDNALDLLYPSAREELRDLMEERAVDSEKNPAVLHARFYRFLDQRGAVIVPPFGEAGVLAPAEEAQLTQSQLSDTIQTGYLTRRDENGRMTVEEMITVPIRSTENNRVIAALVLGFSVETVVHNTETGMQNGILLKGRLRLPTFDQAREEQVAREVTRDLAQTGENGSSLRTKIGGVPHLLFFRRLNPKSNYPPAYEVCVYPLNRLLARQAELRWQILAAGGLLMVGGFAVSTFFSRTLSQPVEALAEFSEENVAQRQRAEAELQSTAEELQRSARFSADASHQLKSPITVLRAGLDSLLTRDGFPPEVYEEISSLIHQTYRLTGVVEDLLLLSRMDAGKLRLSLKSVDLTQLVEEWSEDLHAVPDPALPRVETDIPAGLRIAGEIKYTTLIVQNLLDNARKYNRPDGVIRVSACRSSGEVELHVANTGRGIPAEAQPYVFERFHRAGGNDQVPGHGLGLNLARELVRLHGGELSLVRSDAEWTEFVAVFRAASAPTTPLSQTA